MLVAPLFMYAIAFKLVLAAVVGPAPHVNERKALGLPVQVNDALERTTQGPGKYVQLDTAERSPKKRVQLDDAQRGSQNSTTVTP
ncbi:hypothetical protein B0H13DRAFT_2355690 [Mycena leptocephala]|nr:hypothetical protein B0H13DRAFT_2355690 [Mycena leptocephala]